MRIKFGLGRSISLKPEEFIKATLKSGEFNYVKHDGRLTTVSLPKEWTDGNLDVKVEPVYLKLQKEDTISGQELVKIKQLPENYSKDCLPCWSKIGVQLDENLLNLNQRLPNFQIEIEKQKRVIENFPLSGSEPKKIHPPLLNLGRMEGGAATITNSYYVYKN